MLSPTALCVAYLAGFDIRTADLIAFIHSAQCGGHKFAPRRFNVELHPDTASRGIGYGQLSSQMTTLLAVAFVFDLVRCHTTPPVFLARFFRDRVAELTSFLACRPEDSIRSAVGRYARRRPRHPSPVPAIRRSSTRIAA